jgi:hypothetical protein
VNPFIDMVRFTPNEKRYYLRSLGPLLLAIPLMVGVTVLVDRYRSSWPFEVLIAIALLPLLPMAWAMKQYVDYFKACDEWERLIEIYGICIAVLVVGLTYFGFGILGLLDLVALDGTLFALFMLPAVSLTYVIGKVVGRWRHG